MGIAGSNKIIIVCLVLLMTAGCAGWKINGVPAEKCHNISSDDVVEFAAGMATSVFVHWAGHVAYLESQGADWHQDGIHETYGTGLNDSQKGWFGRAGFISQLVGGTVLKFTPWQDSTFALGYHAGTCAEILTYPVRSNGDLNAIKEGAGNEGGEYVVYSSWALFLFVPCSFFKLTRGERRHHESSYAEKPGRGVIVRQVHRRNGAYSRLDSGAAGHNPGNFQNGRGAFFTISRRNNNKAP